jgi:hypothetical protein
MAIDQDRLDEIVRMFVAHLQHGDAVANHALLMRELAAVDHVLLVEAADDSEALLSVDADSAIAISRLDAGGASIAYWGKLRGFTFEEAFEANTQRTRLKGWGHAPPEVSGSRHAQALGG